MEIRIEKIYIKPDRQRKDLGDLEPLKTSILNVGLINPIVVEPREEEEGTYWLIAGERRLTAYKALHKEGKVGESIPARLFDSLDEITRQLIELEENVKRKDLTWQEHVEAVMRIKELKGFETGEELASYLGISPAHVTRMSSVWAMRENEKIWQAENLSAAYTICKRESARILGSATSDLGFLIQNFINEGDENGQQEERGNSLSSEETQQGGQRPSAGNEPAEDRIQHSTVGGTSSCEQNDSRGISRDDSVEQYSSFKIIQGDFISWAENYSGLPFNLLHLDFPYGINHDRSKQGNTKNFGTYEDTEDIYKTLVRALLKNQDKFVASSAHCICWLSLNFWEWTKKEFEAAGWSCHLQPFIWHKSDNKGIIADTMCGMRNVGEYALVLTRGRRPVIKNISNIFPHPTTKTFHASEKPRPMLEYLFTAFCDEHSRVLDPTCGSGTSIQAAMKLGAESGLGIEPDEEFAKKAQTWLEDEKKLKKVSKVELEDFDLDF